MFDVKKEVPVGDIASASGAKTPEPDAKHAVEVDIPEKEKEDFEIWLRKLWTEKDTDMDRYLETNSFASKKVSTPWIDIPVALKSNWEILHAFCFFWPAGMAYVWGKIRG